MRAPRLNNLLEVLEEQFEYRLGDVKWYRGGSDVKGHVNGVLIQPQQTAVDGALRCLAPDARPPQNLVDQWGENRQLGGVGEHTPGCCDGRTSSLRIPHLRHRVPALSEPAAQIRGDKLQFLLKTSGGNGTMRVGHRTVCDDVTGSANVQGCQGHTEVVVGRPAAQCALVHGEDQGRGGNAVLLGPGQKSFPLLL